MNHGIRSYKKRVFEKPLAFSEFSPDFQSENGFQLTKHKSSILLTVEFYTTHRGVSAQGWDRRCPLPSSRKKTLHFTSKTHRKEKIQSFICVCKNGTLVHYSNYMTILLLMSMHL